MKIAAGFVACVLVLAGCGSGSAESPPAAATSSATSVAVSTPTATSSPSVLTQAEAAAKYEEIRLPYATSTDAFNALYDAQSTDLAAWQAACGQVAQSYDGRARDLAAVTNWPMSTQDEIDALVAALGTSRGFYVQCQQATSMTQVYDAIGRRTGELAGAIQNAKVALGVPSA